MASSTTLFSRFYSFLGEGSKKTAKNVAARIMLQLLQSEAEWKKTFIF